MTIAKKIYDFQCRCWEINSLLVSCKNSALWPEHLFCGAFIGISMFGGCAATRGEGEEG